MGWHGLGQGLVAEFKWADLYGHRARPHLIIPKVLPLMLLLCVCVIVCAVIIAVVAAIAEGRKHRRKIEEYAKEICRERMSRGLAFDWQEALKTAEENVDREYIEKMSEELYGKE